MDTAREVYVHVANVKPDTERKELKNHFEQFGEITKLFYRPGGVYCNIYYATPESAHTAISELQANPVNEWRVVYGHSQPRKEGGNPQEKREGYQDRSNKSDSDRINWNSGKSTANSLEHNTNHNSISNRLNSEDAATMGDLANSSLVHGYVNVHGEPVTVRKCKEDGQLYIALKDIRDTGFEIFSEDNFDHLLVLNEQVTKEFYEFILSQTKLFLLKHKVRCVDESHIARLIENARNQLLNPGSAKNNAADSPRQSGDFNASQDRGSGTSDNFRRSGHGPNVRRDRSCNRTRLDATVETNSRTNDRSPRERNGFDNRRERQSQQQSGRPSFDGQRNDRQSDGHRTERQAAGGGRPFPKRSLGEPSQFVLNRSIQGGDDELNIKVTTSNQPHGKLRPPKNLDGLLHGDSRNGEDGGRVNGTAEETKSVSSRKLSPARSTGSARVTFTPEASDSTDVKASASSSSLTALQKNKAAQEQAPRKKLERVELEQAFQEVVVSYIEPDEPNTCWVYLKAQEADLITVHEDLGTLQKEGNAETVEAAMNLPCLAEYLEDDIFRAEVVSLNPLKVSYIDYGNVEQVDVVKKLPDHLANIPALAVKILIENLGSRALQTHKSLQVKPLKKLDDGSYLVTLKEDEGGEKKTATTAGTSGTGGNRDQAPKLAPKAPKPKKEEKPSAPSRFHGKPDQLHELKDQEKVMIVGEEGGQLYLRSRECYSAFNSVASRMREFKGESLPSVTMEEVVSVSKDGETRRAVVSGLAGSKAVVDFLDYPGSAEIDVATLRSISEQLAREPCTLLLSPKLRGLDKLGEQSRKLVKEAIASKNKYTVRLSGTMFDLLAADGTSLAEILKTADNPPEPKPAPSAAAKLPLKKPAKTEPVLLDHLKMYELKMGEGHYFVFSVNGVEEMTIFPAEEEFDGVNALEKVTLAELPPTEPYFPVEEEVCLGIYTDTWCRCAILSENAGAYAVYFIDYGTRATLKPSELRRLEPGLEKIPIMGLESKLAGVEPSSEADAVVKRILDSEFEVYQINVLRLDKDATYEIEIPEVTAELRHAGLL